MLNPKLLAHNLQTSVQAHVKEIETGTLEDLLRSFALSMQRRRSELLAQHGISESDIEILRYLNLNEVKKMKDLGDVFGLKFSTLTSTVDRLEDNKLVKRKASKDDRRVVYVNISQRGKSFLEAVNDLYTGAANQLREGLTPVEITKLSQLLAVLMERN